jgi:hypothetical protein
MVKAALEPTEFIASSENLVQRACHGVRRSEGMIIDRKDALPRMTGSGAHHRRLFSKPPRVEYPSDF